MAKKKDNTLIYIGAAAILYFLLMRKKASATANKPAQMQRIEKNVNSLQLDPVIDENDYFKQQYKESLNACSY